ncbi:MAG: pitrilysin family protein [Bacteroidota bacterium]
MKKTLLFAILTLLNFSVQAQNIKFEEYTLENGLHVILHKDNTAPVVAVSVSYHVGSKNEDSTRTGFAHFFEHLLFEGSENIKRGEYDKYVKDNGGVLNANTSMDRTYYYEIFPSNKLEMGLWLESERMMHAKIDTVGVQTQREVVKEEKRSNYDNVGYRSFMGETAKRMFTVHPYRWITIGSMEHIGEAQLGEFMEFYKTFYVPNNAVLTIAGDIDEAQTKKWVSEYFGTIPKGTHEIVSPEITEPFLTEEIVDTIYDANIQIPAVFVTYRTPKQTDKDAYVMNFINDILSGGASSRIHKKIVEKEQIALQSGSFVMNGEDYGRITFYGLVNQGKKLDELLSAIDSEIDNISTSLISPKEHEKEINQLELGFVSRNRRMSGVAESLADYYLYFGNTNLVNTEIDKYRSITKEDIKRVASEYFKKERRVVLYYYPKK